MDRNTDALRTDSRSSPMLARTPPALLGKYPKELHRIVRERKAAEKKHTLRPRATIDFETRSACDLKRRGAWLYSKDPTTEILCLAYRLPGWKPGKTKLWHMAHPEIGVEESPIPQDLLDWIEFGGLVEAHNSFFEWAVWNHIAVPRFGWPALDQGQMLCSAAKASAHALPRDLKGAVNALGLSEKKDDDGKRLLNKFSKPARMSKNEKAIFGDMVFFTIDEEITKLWSYCRQDVIAEEGLSEALADLSPMEESLWRITQRMNARGVTIDVELCRAALRLAGKAKAKMNAEFEELTGIESATQRGLVKTWLANNGFEVADTKAKTIEWHLDRNPILKEPGREKIRRVLEIVKQVNRTSTNKYKRMLECVDTDNKARELLVYCGAERTGRFAGKGIQVHNLPKGRFAKGLVNWKTFKKGDPEPIDLAVEDIKSENLAWCEAIHGDVMNLIASCLRGALIASPGKEFMTADYAAIEARCVLWEAGADGALEIFRVGGDIYCDMASGIYGYLIVKDEKAQLRAEAMGLEARIAAVINAMGSTQRDFGKVAILGLGFGMGFLKFLITLRTYNIVLSRDEVRKMMGRKRLEKYEAIVTKKLFPSADDYTDPKKFKTASRQASLARRALLDEREQPKEVIHELALCKYTVDTYRSRYPEVPAMWKAQERAAIAAIENPDEEIPCGVVTWFMDGDFLKCRLPSGRCLCYYGAHLKAEKNAWGKVVPGIRFYGRNQTSGAWSRQATYGGKLTENITQAIARDIMAFAKLALDGDENFDLLISVHDEIVAEVDEGCGDEDSFAEQMAALPEAFDGCPIVAEPKRYKRYRK
jgi:DNA polymerase